MTNPMQYADMKVITYIIKLPSDNRLEMDRILTHLQFGEFNIIPSKEELDRINQIFQERPSLP